MAVSDIDLLVTTVFLFALKMSLFIAWLFYTFASILKVLDTAGCLLFLMCVRAFESLFTLMLCFTEMKAFS